MRDGDVPWLCGMLENVMATSNPYQNPSVFLEDVDHFLTSHKTPIGRDQHCVYYTMLTGESSDKAGIGCGTRDGRRSFCRWLPICSGHLRRGHRRTAGGLWHPRAQQLEEKYREKERATAQSLVDAWEARDAALARASTSFVK